ncbi:NAC domain-containing protein 104 [Eutrema salsugineum]|uniref:NAC domain-containing protein 104 n=1 Tax=Eutrema salsugineum TaxID=72664 RepID=UPI000CED66C3|nr:NAC domain-containing protein 104 [Eutrema salsugineum]
MEPKFRPLPVGFRFRPTDYQMSSYFLKKKALGQPMRVRIIPEECLDLFSKHPSDLPGFPKEKHLYFYCRKTNGQDPQNLWTQIGEDTVFDPQEEICVGIKRSFTLIEHEEESNDIRLPDEEELNPRVEWYMDEISLPTTVADTDWVLCHVFYKEEGDFY